MTIDYTAVYRLNSANIATAADIATGTSVDKLTTAKAVADAAVAGGWAGGGGGSPGGSTTQVQYNNAGAFGGITGATTNGTALTLVAPALGTPASGVLTNCTGTASGLTAGAVSTISGLITAGSGIAVTGSGTSGSPYSIAATGGGGGGSWTLAAKTSDQSKTSDSTFGNDSALTFAVSASTKYIFRGKLFFNAATVTPGFKYQFTGPASPTKYRLTRNGITFGGTAFTGTQVDTAFSVSVAYTGNNGDAWVEFDGMLQNGANAGNVTLQWAQSTSNGNATTLYAGSYLEYAAI